MDKPMGKMIWVVYLPTDFGLPEMIRAFKHEARARDYVAYNRHKYKTPLGLASVPLEDD